MILSAFKSRRPFALGLIFIFTFAAGLQAQEQLYSEYKCAFTLPEDYRVLTNLPPQPELIAAFSNPTKTRVIQIMVSGTNTAPGQMDDRFVAGMESGIQSSGGGKKISGKFIEVAGIKSYERIGSLSLKGRQISTFMETVPANGRCYSLVAMAFDEDANTDPEIQKAFSSFRFLTPPTLPASTHPAGSAAYQMGVITGELTAFIFCVAAVVGVILMIIRQKKTVRPPKLPTQPPPLPPSS